MSAAVAFGSTANPDAYVPWSGSERALAALVRWARGTDAPICVLTGPPGMGKTLLLKLLATQTRDSLRSLYLAYPDTPRAGLHEFLLQGLGIASLDLSADAVVAALGADSEPVLLLIDEGELLPLDTVHGLHELATAAAGRLRVAIAVTRDARAEELAAAFGDDADSVRIEGAMSPAEVTRHVREQLARAEIDVRIGARFDSATLARLHQRSEGIPASLQSLAAGLLFEAQRARGDFRPRKPDPPPTPEQPAEEPASAVASHGRAGRRGAEGAHQVAVASRRRAGRRGAEGAHQVGRGRVFVLGAVLGIAAGIAAVALVPRAFDAQRADGAASAVESEPTLPEVSAARPSETIATTPLAPTPSPAPAGAPVTVSFNAAPWAYVEIDGRLIGVTPIAAHPVAPGRHRVMATLPDGHVVERDVEIRADLNRRIVFP